MIEHSNKPLKRDTLKQLGNWVQPHNMSKRLNEILMMAKKTEKEKLASGLYHYVDIFKGKKLVKK